MRCPFNIYRKGTAWNVIKRSSSFSDCLRRHMLCSCVFEFCWHALCTQNWEISFIYCWSVLKSKRIMYTVHVNRIQKHKSTTYEIYILNNHIWSLPFYVNIYTESMTNNSDEKCSMTNNSDETISKTKTKQNKTLSYVPMTATMQSWYLFSFPIQRRFQ